MISILPERLNEHSFGSLPAMDNYQISCDIYKWMRMARNVAELERPCLSRSIGVVIVDPRTDSLISTGHNGPPEHTPRPDDAGYLRNVVWPQLNAAECASAGAITVELLVSLYANSGTCPRKIIGAKSGQRLELCSCVHAETNAIIKAHRNVCGCWMFCWCGVPCVECTKLILQANIHMVFALETGSPDYSPYSSRYLFETGRTHLVLVRPEFVG